MEFLWSVVVIFPDRDIAQKLVQRIGPTSIDRTRKGNNVSLRINHFSIRFTWVLILEAEKSMTNNLVTHTTLQGLNYVCHSPVNSDWPSRKPEQKESPQDPEWHKANIYPRKP